MVLREAFIVWLFSQFSIAASRQMYEGELANLPHNGSFPSDFTFGVASSAYQIEGAWNEDGKGEQVWDSIAHRFLRENQTGDIACDSYHKYKEDVRLLKELGVQSYRFSLSWSRILPRGFVNEVNPAGVAYYNNLINMLVDAGIEPLVTMFHFDLPMTLTYLGGWNNDDIVDYFEGYADLLFSLFGDRVRTWITVNEPQSFCSSIQARLAQLLPYIPTGITEYTCAKNVLLAHARVYHMYRRKYWKKQKGKISMVLNAQWSEPATNKSKDIKAAERVLQFDFGLYAHPIFKLDYPEVVKEYVKKKSRKQNFPESRLPPLSPADILYVRNTLDFIGLNHYSTKLVKAADTNAAIPSMNDDMSSERFPDPSWETSQDVNIQAVPWGMRKMLNWIKQNYGDVEIYITENGYPVKNESQRIAYIQGYLSAVQQAIYTDNIRVKSYYYWSLMDSFEWTGYQYNFGLHSVDFNDPERPRTPKLSASYYKRLMQTRRLSTNW